VVHVVVPLDRPNSRRRRVAVAAEESVGGERVVFAGVLETAADWRRLWEWLHDVEEARLARELFAP